MQGLNVKYPEQQIAIIIIINFPPITYGLRPEAYQGSDLFHTRFPGKG